MTFDDLVKTGAPKKKRVKGDVMWFTPLNGTTERVVIWLGPGTSSPLTVSSILYGTLKINVFNIRLKEACL